MPRLEPYPAHWTVRQARDAYLAENGFTVEAYERPTTDVKLWKLTFRFPNTPRHRWALKRHDLHHVATGYGTDFRGEYEISAWEARLGLRHLGLYVSSIVVTGALGGVVLCPRRALAAWRAGGRSRASLFTPAHEYDELLELTVGELRERLGLPREGLARERRLHGHAPEPAERATAEAPRAAA